MWKEFKNFIQQGNVIDMAVGIILGTAFTEIVNSVVEDVLMPIITGLTAGVEFEDLVVNVGGATLKFGNLINAIITFLIIALVLFAILKSMNKIEPVSDEPLQKNVLTVKVKFQYLQQDAQTVHQYLKDTKTNTQKMIA